MAKAGYCSECGRNVYLTPEGACELGHGPECIRDAYDVMEPPAAPEPAEPAVPVAPAVPAEPAASVTPPTLPVTPPRNRTGLVVMIVVILLLLGACVLGGPVVWQAISKARGTQGSTAPVPADRAKITASIGFMEALLNNDALAIKPYLTDSAQSAITKADWDLIASESATGAATFSAPSWTGDAKAVVTFDSGDATGTITFSVDAKKADAVIMDGVSLQGTEHDIIGLAKAGTGWRVLTLDNGAGDVTAFDAAFVKSMVP